MPEDLHWQKYASRFKTFELDSPPSVLKPDMILCIPVYAEPDVISTLESLAKCSVPACRIEVLLLFNQSSRMTHEEHTIHDQSWTKVLEWVDGHLSESLQFIPIYVEHMPDPKGGVGWARKLVMDEAARRLRQEGILVCLDADCVVAENYLTAVYAYFTSHPDHDAVSIYFEHPLEGLPLARLNAIVQYELHLRYLVQAMRWTGHPFAYHTVGSSMAVRRSTYLAQGGMNTRQAGEDFYFLQKCIELGRFAEMNTTTVYPAARISSRVPFGTGRAMIKMENEGNAWRTTNFEIFRQIKPLLSDIERVYEFAEVMDGKLPSLNMMNKLSDGLLLFLGEVNFVAEIRSIRKHTNNFESFRKRFFRYFNAFMMIRYMHYMSRSSFAEIAVSEAAGALARELNLPIPLHADEQVLLRVFRSLEYRNQP